MYNNYIYNSVYGVTKVEELEHKINVFLKFEMRLYNPLKLVVVKEN